MLAYLFCFHKELYKERGFQIYIQNKNNCKFLFLLLSYTFMGFWYVSDLLSLSWITFGHFHKPFLDFIFSAVRKTVVKTHTEVSKDFVSHKHKKDADTSIENKLFQSCRLWDMCLQTYVYLCLYIYIYIYI